MELIDELLEDAKGRMAKSVDRAAASWPRSAPAAPPRTCSIASSVDYYGTPTPLKQLANVATTDARLLTVTPFDKSSFGGDRESDPGVRRRADPEQ